ncbi:MAG: HEAT repeat domain-containing protein [Planctomycetota bacterium]
MIVFLAVAFVCSALFPHYKSPLDVWSRLNRNMLIFLACAAFFGTLFGLVLNRFMLVAYSSGPAEEVPLSWAAKLGRPFRGWRGIVVVIVLIGAVFGWDGIRPVYYRTPIFGRVPGLALWQPDNIRLWTAECLAVHKKNAGAFDSLVDALGSDPLREVRLWVCWALTNLGDARAIEHLVTAMEKDPEPDVRARAASALGYFYNPETVAPLLEAIKADRSIDVRESAIRALGMVGSSRALPRLQFILLKDRKVGIRVAAAWALGKIGDRRALPALISVRDSTDIGYLRMHAAEAVNEIAAGESSGGDDYYE